MQADKVAPNPLLSSIAVDFKNRAYIAKQTLTPIGVPNMLCQYVEWDKGTRFKRPKAEMAQNGVANSIDVKGSKKAITLQTRALRTFVDELERTQGALAMIEAHKTEILQDNLLLDMELRVAAKLCDSSVLTNNDDLSGSNQWSDDDSDPVGAVAAAQASLPIRGNTMILGYDVFNRVRIHPKILEALQFTAASGLANLEQLARLFEVDRVLIGEATVDTAGEGLAEDKELIWQEQGGPTGGIAILAYVAPTPPSPLMDQPTLGYIPVLGGGGSPTTRVYRSIDQNAGTGGGLTVIKAEMAYETLVSAPDMAFLWTSVLT